MQPSACRRQPFFFFFSVILVCLLLYYFSFFFSLLCFIACMENCYLCRLHCELRAHKRIYHDHSRASSAHGDDQQCRRDQRNEMKKKNEARKRLRNVHSGSSKSKSTARVGDRDWDRDRDRIRARATGAAREGDGDVVVVALQSPSYRQRAVGAPYVARSQTSPRPPTEQRGNLIFCSRLQFCEYGEWKIAQLREWQLNYYKSISRIVRRVRSVAGRQGDGRQGEVFQCRRIGKQCLLYNVFKGNDVASCLLPWQAALN